MVLPNNLCGIQDCYIYIILSFLLTFVVIFALNLIIFKKLLKYAKKRYHLEN